MMRRFVGPVLVIAVALLALSGCASKPATIPNASSDATSTPRVAAQTASTEGSPATQPAPAALPAVSAAQPGVSEPSQTQRKPMMVAARALLKTKSVFVVNQLRSNGAWAIGHLTPTNPSGPSVWVAWRNEVNGGWKAIWSSTARDHAANSIVALDPRFSPAVIKAFDWADLRVVKAGLVKAIQASCMASCKVGANVSVEGLYRDSRGDYWGSVIYSLVTGSDDVAAVWRRRGGVWKYYARDPSVGEADGPPSWEPRLPAEVERVLGSHSNL